MEAILGNKRRRLEQRRQESIDRQAERVSRTNKQQLEKLDERLGKGVGATKERERLQALIDEAESKKRKKKTKSKTKAASKESRKNNKKSG